MSARRIIRTVAVVLLLVCCAAGAFAVARQLRRPARSAAVTSLQPPTLRLHSAYSLSQLPGLPPLSHRSQ